MRRGLALLVLTACPGAGGGPVAPPPAGADAGSARAPVEIAQIACGDFHCCALVKDGTVQCWGRDGGGELGDGGGGDRPSPIPVEGLGGVAELALGASFSCARMNDGTVRCWGSGRLFGGAAIVDKARPTKVPGLSGATQLRAGGYVVCALAEGGARCWGLEPPLGEAPKGAVELVVAGAHGCARLGDGTARCWGEGVWGAAAGKTSFAEPGVRGAKQLATGDAFACALLESGAVSCWGRNDEAELGVQPDSDDHPAGAAVPRVGGVTALAAAESHVCAITAGALVSCWGANDEGELGRGTRTIGEGPLPIVGLRAKQLALGADHVCVLGEGGAISCWGSNRNGQLGDGTTERRLSPSAVRLR